MLGAVALLVWAVLLGVLGPVALRRAGWPTRSPRIGLLVWQAASVSFVAALILGGLALAAPATVLSGGLSDLLTNCIMAVRDAYRTPAGAGAAGAGLILASGVTGRVGWCLSHGLHRAARRRREHAQRLALVAHRDETLGVLVVTHPSLQAYCLPGRGATIVITSATLAALHPEELGAVLSHERAHVRARHHLVVAAAAGLAHAFPKVPLLRDAAVAIPALVEMAADDSAGRCTDRGRVATALLALAGTAAPAAALAAGGPGALRRVQRMLRPSTPLSLGATTAACGLAVTLLLAPAIAAVAPAWAAGPMNDCKMRMVEIYGATASRQAVAGKSLELDSKPEPGPDVLQGSRR